MTRQIEGLVRARISERPLGLPVSRLRGAKREGMVFERSLEGQLPSGARNGQWWEFWDRNGLGYCQTDWVIEAQQSVLLLECKLGQHWEAWQQIEGLYGPVLAMATGKRVFGVQVCKFLRKDRASDHERLVHTLEDALEACRAGARPVLHWSGLAPLRRNPPVSHMGVAGARGTVAAIERI